MKKILAFGASNNPQSINKAFAYHTANQVSGAEVTLIDLNDFEMPLYGVGREKEIGIPASAKHFFELVQSHDGLVISLAEYNQNFTTAFKNLVDWTSRIQKGIWQNKPMLLLSTAPGPRGGASVMEIAIKFMPYMAADIVGHFSLPSFRNNFDPETGIKDLELKKGLEKQTAVFIEALNKEVIPQYN